MRTTRIFLIIGTFFYLCSLLDGCSCYIVYRELKEAVKEAGRAAANRKTTPPIPAIHPPRTGEKTLTIPPEKSLTHAA